MIFENMLPGQKLILVRIDTKQPPTSPLVAKSAPTEPEPEPLWLAMILWLLAHLGMPAIRKIRSTWPNIAALGFLASVLMSVILEQIATGYIQKMVGVI